VQERVAGRPQGAVIRARRQGTVIFGSLSLVWVLALAASVSAQPTASGKITAGVVFGVFLAATVAGWVAVARRRGQLEIGPDAIAHRKGTTVPVALDRTHGDSLLVLPRLSDGSLSRPARLALLGSGGVLSLDGFSPDEVRRTCEAQGWRFDGDSRLTVKDAQVWLHRGMSFEAVQLIELFGPFPDVAVDDDAGMALTAAVLEDYGDKLIRRNRSAARRAYGRAANAQRAFAGYAASPDQGAARMAEADRIDGKARG
jgi:hypothetical protein